MCANVQIIHLRIFSELALKKTLINALKYTTITQIEKYSTSIHFNKNYLL